MLTLIQILIVGLATGVVAQTITRSKIFYGLRSLTDPFSKIGQLIRCPYCTSHWVALFFLLSSGLQTTNGNWFFIFLINWFSITAIAAVFTKFYNSFSALEEYFESATQYPEEEESE